MTRIEVDERTAKLAGRGTDLKQTTPAEFDFDAELAALTFDGPTLPADFSRLDIYCDHD